MGLINWLRQLCVGHTINGRCSWQRRYVVEHQSGRNVGAVLTTVLKATVNSAYIETERPMPWEKHVCRRLRVRSG